MYTQSIQSDLVFDILIILMGYIFDEARFYLTTAVLVKFLNRNKDKMSIRQGEHVFTEQIEHCSVPVAIGKAWYTVFPIYHLPLIHA